MNPVENEAVVAEVNVSIVFYTNESSKEWSFGLLHLLKEFCAQRLPYISSNICTLLPAYRKLWWIFGFNKVFSIKEGIREGWGSRLANLEE
jgi:hypothetical protein